MNGYETLNHREADFLWDSGRERELDKFFDELDKALESETANPEPCDLYDRCRECPNFKDCFNLPNPQVSRKVNI
jgi:hypothetical protein